MKCLLLSLMAIVIANGSPEGNIVLNVKQVVSGCKGSCGTASDEDNGSSHEISKENPQAKFTEATIATTATTSAITTTIPAKDGCYIGSHLFTNGTSLLGAICLIDEWAPFDGLQFYMSKQISCGAGFPFKVKNFDGEEYKASTCSYDMIYMEGETTFSVKFDSKGTIQDFTISNTGSEPVVCHYNSSNGLWNCNFTFDASPTIVPGQEILQVLFQDTFKMIMNGNGIQILFYGTNIILIAPDFMNTTTLEGLCGNNNGNIADDMTKRDGELTTNVTEFLMSWQSEGAICP